jgi:DnaK suppressor protein
MAQSKTGGSKKAVDKKQQPTAEKAGAGKTVAKKAAAKKAVAQKTTDKKTTIKKTAGQKMTGKKTGSGATNILPADYRPSQDEPFMNPVQLEYFRQKLLRWRAELLFEASQTLTNLSSESLHRPDQMDRAQIESNAALDLRTRDRERKLLQKIEAALRRIEDGSYGYCEETGDPISIARLEARPIASLSLHAQEQHERMERVHRDD